MARFSHYPTIIPATLRGGSIPTFLRLRPVLLVVTLFGLVVVAASGNNAPAQDASPNQRGPDSPPPSGLWEGKYTCADGWIAGFTLLVSPGSDNSLEARFKFFPVTELPSVKKGEYLLEGSFSSKSNEIRRVTQIELQPTEWIDQPQGYSWSGLSGTITENWRENPKKDYVTFKLTEPKWKCGSLVSQRAEGKSPLSAAGDQIAQDYAMNPGRRPESPPSLEGLWEGTVLCGRRDADGAYLRSEIGSALSISLSDKTVEVKYNYFPTVSWPDLESGEYTLGGSFSVKNKDEGRLKITSIELQPKKWINQPAGHTWSRMSGELRERLAADPKEDELTIRFTDFKECGALRLARADGGSRLSAAADQIAREYKAQQEQKQKREAAAEQERHKALERKYAAEAERLAALRAAQDEAAKQKFIQTCNSRSEDIVFNCDCLLDEGRKATQNDQKGNVDARKCLDLDKSRLRIEQSCENDKKMHVNARVKAVNCSCVANSILKQLTQAPQQMPVSSWLHADSLMMRSKAGLECPGSGSTNFAFNPAAPSTQAPTSPSPSSTPQRPAVAAVTLPPAPVKPPEHVKPTVGILPKPGTGSQYKPGDTLRDCDECPEMVVLPGGDFTMGSPPNEENRYEWEGPQHRVHIPAPFAVGKFEVTRDQFDAFVKDSGYNATSDGSWPYCYGSPNKGSSYLDPGFKQTGIEPAVCVNWADAKSYVAWLSKKTGKRYRLLSEAEWEYSARAGTTTRFPNGAREIDLCAQANLADAAYEKAGLDPTGILTAACSDGYAYTSPVGAFEANGFGLHDMQGNVAEWIEDCFRNLENGYVGAPADGSWKASDGNCVRGTRGGSFHDIPERLRSAYRDGRNPRDRMSDLGFRVAREIIPQKLAP